MLKKYSLYKSLTILCSPRNFFSKIKWFQLFIVKYVSLIFTTSHIQLNSVTLSSDRLTDISIPIWLCRREEVTSLLLARGSSPSLSQAARLKRSEVKWREGISRLTAGRDFTQLSRHSGRSNASM